MQMSVKANKLVIEVPLDAEGRPSKSGKNTLLATTGGTSKVLTPSGEISVNLNVYRPLS
jgi:hypothetical protein